MDQMAQTITEWRNYIMSALGNLVAAGNAKAIGKYNNAVYQQQADYETRKAEVRKEVYNKVEKPKLLEAQKYALAEWKVRAMASGAEFASGTPQLVYIKNIENQLFDVALSDYNSEITYTDGLNQASLLRSKGSGEFLKGKLTAQAEYVKAGASLLGMANQSKREGELVIV